MDIDQAARVLHEANRAIQMSQKDETIGVSAGWDETGEEDRLLTMAGVQGPLDPEASHELWMDQRIADGWVYGPTKDEEARTHPSLVPYDELPEDQKLKDKLFVAIVGVFREAVTD
jgi:hypothetical protein